MVRKSVDELESAKKHDPFETMRLVKAIIGDSDNKIQPSFMSKEVPLQRALEDAFNDCEPFCKSYSTLEACLASYCPFWINSDSLLNYPPIIPTEQEKLEEFENFSEILEDVLSYTQNISLLNDSHVLERIKGIIEGTLSDYGLEIVPFGDSGHIFRCKKKDALLDQAATLVDKKAAQAISDFQCAKSENEERGSLDVLIDEVEADNATGKSDALCNAIHGYIQKYRHYKEKEEKKENAWFYEKSLEERMKELFQLCIFFLSAKAALPVLNEYGEKSK
jgi:hypothetical protein